MKKNIAKFVSVSILIGIVWTSTPGGQSDWFTFRNQQYKFRFIYPPDWHIATPRGPNVRGSVTTSNDKQPANWNIVVKYTPELTRYTQAKLDREIKAASWSKRDWEEMLSGKFSDVHIFETRKIKVDNQPAQLAVATYSYETTKAKLNTTTICFFRVTPGLAWHFTCATGGGTYGETEQNFEYWKPTFLRIISSFVFEN